MEVRLDLADGKITQQWAKWAKVNDSTIAAKAIIGILSEFLVQVQWLDLSLVPFKVISLLRAKNLPGPPPALARLELGNNDEDILEEDVDDDVRILGGYSPPPSPRYLTLSSVIPPQLLNISWVFLTNITLEFTSRRVAFQVLALTASSLQELKMQTINGYCEFDEQWHPAERVDIPNLRILSYSNDHASDGTAHVLFDACTFPQLASLEYDGDATYNENYMPTATMILCLQRSLCRLTTLKLNYADMRDMPALVALLRETMELTTLHASLDSRHSADPLLEALYEGNKEHPDFLPHLRMLNLVTNPTFSWQAFANVWLCPGAFDETGKFRITEPEFHPCREKLQASIDVLDDENEGCPYWITPPAIFALLCIIPRVPQGIEITQEGVKKSPTGVRWTFNLLKLSFLHHFPIVEPSHRKLYDLAVENGIF